MADILIDVNDTPPPLLDDDGSAAARLERLKVQMQAVRRRSQLVRRLRRLLPIAIILTIIVSIGWIIGQSIVNSLNVYEASADEIRMVNPRFVGQTGNEQPYTISGLEAVMQGRNAPTITLKSPNIEIKGSAERPTIVTADNGVYDRETQKFTMTGNVVLGAGASEFTLRTDEAVLDLSNSVIYGDKHVEAFDSLRHIEGESFILQDEGNLISFKGRGTTQVKAVIQE